MTTFDKFNLPKNIVEALAKLQITTPTPIQSSTIQLSLDGHDVLASAQTGSGKTIAYLIPLIMKLTAGHGSALILAPTRELAMQVHQALLQLLGPTTNLKTALLIGGAPMGPQLGALKRGPRVIVGTPGRITDHLTRGSLSMKSTSFLVIDEADRMLDMGFGVQLDKIAKYLPPTRQTLMFSATLPPNIESLSKKYLKNPQRVTVDTKQQAAPKIKQDVIQTSVAEKRNHLLEQLGTREGLIIIFVRTRRKADSLSKELQVLGHKAEAMHGDLPQRRRERVIQSFRSNKSRIMVATDVAARGLDIPNVMHIINYDLPECAEDYVHRIGRTARANAEGFALSFVSSGDAAQWRAISKLMNLPPIQFAHEPRSSPGRHRPQQRRTFRPQRWAKRS
jgi:superfamily II DNA/RNA helicase